LGHLRWARLGTAAEWRKRAPHGRYRVRQINTGGRRDHAAGAANRVAYNKAAGADNKERTLRSYVLGHYKSERNEVTGSAKPVSLRDHNGYSVILGVFHNAGYDQTVTLAQVFWMKEAQGQPARFFRRHGARAVDRRRLCSFRYRHRAAAQEAENGGRRHRG